MKTNARVVGKAGSAVGSWYDDGRHLYVGGGVETPGVSPPALNCDISGPASSSLILNRSPSRSAGSASWGIWMSQSSSPPAAGATGSDPSSTRGLMPAGTYSSPGSYTPGPLIAFVPRRVKSWGAALLCGGSRAAVADDSVTGLVFCSAKAYNLQRVTEGNR